MEFLKDLKNGDIKSIILVILIIFMFHQYWGASNIAKSIKQIQCKDNKEPMADVSNDIKEAVKQVYLADVEAIRNLSEIATKINAGTFVFPGNLTVTGQIKANSSINAGGEIGNNSNSISQITNKLNELSNSINNTNNSINQINSSLTNSVNEINQRTPVFVRFIARDTNNFTSHEWVFTLDSELMLLWHNNDTVGVRNKVVAKATRLGYSLPLTRVKVPHNSWDFRDWTSFVISIPPGKAVRIFSWANQPDNDKHYGPGVHYIKDLNLPVQGGFHGMWAGLDAKKYELIPQGSTVQQMYNL